MLSFSSRHSLAAVGSLLILAASTALAGCAAVADGVSCSGTANNVHRSSGTSSDMVGKGTGSCTGAVEISGYVEIQRLSGSTWVMQKRTGIDTFTTVSGVRFTRQAATSCRSGTFRTKTYVRGTYKGESHAVTRYSGKTTNPCA